MLSSSQTHTSSQTPHKGVINSLLDSPTKVGGLCLLIWLFSVLGSGHLFQLISLKNDIVEIQARKEKALQQIKQTEAALKKAQDPAFLEKVALEKWDFARKNEIIFVFSDDDVLE